MLTHVMRLRIRDFWLETVEKLRLHSQIASHPADHVKGALSYTRERNLTAFLV